jgi:hypothetical protein
MKWNDPDREQGAHRMKGQGIHGPDVIDVFNGLAMAFESIFFLLGSRARVKVFNGNSTFC